MRQFEDKFLIPQNFFYYRDVTVTMDSIRGSIIHCYRTLDMIDQHLTEQRVQKLSKLVELANLSSIVGNLLGAGFAENSNGLYYRNRPHSYPDLVSTTANAPGIEIKTALRTNYPKGHQPKAGYYLTYRYCLTNEYGNLNVSNEEELDTVTIWEVKFGYLSSDCFSCSNTAGDSGKTAVIKTSALNSMPLLYLNLNCIPYKNYKGMYEQ